MSVIPSLGTVSLSNRKVPEPPLGPQHLINSCCKSQVFFKRPVEEYTSPLLSCFLDLGVAAGVEGCRGRGMNRHETRQQVRPTLNGLPTLKPELQTKAGSHLSLSPKCLRKPSCPEAYPMAPTCHLPQKATFVENAASTEPENLAMQLAPVLDPESICLTICPRHRDTGPLSLACLLEAQFSLGR